MDIVHGVNAEGGIVINAMRPRGTMTAEARQALEIYELPICPTPIVQRAALARQGQGGSRDQVSMALDQTETVMAWKYPDRGFRRLAWFVGVIFASAAIVWTWENIWDLDNNPDLSVSPIDDPRNFAVAWGFRLFAVAICAGVGWVIVRAIGWVVKGFWKE